jgi:inner membrane protein
MDPPTHGLLGAVIGQALFARRLGRRALPWGAALSMLPDVDVVMFPVVGGLAEWRYHRTLTHGLLFAGLAGAAAGWLLWLWQRRRSGSRGSDAAGARAWIALGVVAMLTHPLADAFTSYGTLLLWPSSRRYAWDAVPIVDLIFSGVLLLALAAGWLWGERGRVAAMAGLAALVFLVAYEAYGLRLNDRAQAEARRQVESLGAHPDQVHAYPVLLLPWLRRVVVREGDGIAVGWVSTWAPGPIQWHRMRGAVGPAVEAARHLESVRLFEWFAMGQTMAALGQAPEGAWVEIDDLRYGFPDDPGHGLWGVRARVGRDGRPVGMVALVRRPRPVSGSMTRWLWQATFGGTAALTGVPAHAPASGE